MHVTGHFETHLTVSVDDTAALDRLRVFGASIGVKFTHIVLSHGTHPSQPMLTRHSQGSLEETLRDACDLRDQLAHGGLPVSRVKIEVDANNPVTPRTPFEAVERPASCHFEHHVKVLIPSGSNLAGLQKAALENAAVLSRNAFRDREKAGEERFLTQRFYALDRPSAKTALTALQVALQFQKIPILDTEEEYVVFDSFSAMDEGWLRTP